MPSKLKKLGINAKGKVHKNLPIQKLINKALEHNEGVLSKNGSLSTKTGKYTGRSFEDKFIVDDNFSHKKIAWSKANLPIADKVYNNLYSKITKYLSQTTDLYIFDGAAGADQKNQIQVRVITELAIHSLFIQNMLLRLSKEQLKMHKPYLTIIVAPGCKAVPHEDKTNSEAFIILNLKDNIAIIGGTYYAGEIKKSIFSYMNFLLPHKNILPMHCSANVDKSGNSALFFGLSGTGKTTLSTDKDRALIGDDEHAWSSDGIFNIEGGCYAKCINLSKENEPHIYNAIRHGAICENVVLDPKTLEYDFNDDTLAENSRVSYPIDHIPNHVKSGTGPHPKTIVFLTADAFGVLPPISKLSKNSAAYHFLSGYTSKLAGTERGVTEPQATFSTLFGEPFMPLAPIRYAQLFQKYLNEYNSEIFLVNTGWSGGPYGIGERISIPHTRAMVNAALNGELTHVVYRKDTLFNLSVPVYIKNVPSELLDPIQTWSNSESYTKSANELAKMFINNFQRFKNIPQEIISSGPTI